MNVVDPYVPWSCSGFQLKEYSCRVTATQSIIKVTEQSVCFGRGGVTAFTERRVTGV